MCVFDGDSDLDDVSVVCVMVLNDEVFLSLL